MTIKDLLQNHATDKEILKSLENIHSFDIAEMFKDLNQKQINIIKNILPAEQFADILSYLDPEEAADYLSEHSLDEQVEVVQNLDPDDAADIINELDAKDKLELINELDDSNPVIQLIQFEEEIAGSYMTNDILTVLYDESVKSATKKLIKKAVDLKSIKTIFVIDEQGHYKGQITLKNLIRAKEPSTVVDILEQEPILNVYDDVEHIIKHIKHYGAYDIAITDSNGVLLGAITTDDLLDMYRDEAVEDIEKLAMLPDTDVEMNMFKSALHRLPWLLILMVLSIPLALITSNFEAILTSVVILALFQPLLLDAGGDVASQTLAVTLVGLTSKKGATLKDGTKEIISGVISGFVMALLAFIAAMILGYTMQVQNPFMVGIVVGLSLWVTVILAPILGYFIPMILHKLKFDPAVASGPFITTLIDILSIVIYFGLATLMLGGYIHG